MMRARYGIWSSALSISPPRGCSFFWKEICRFGQAIWGHTSWIIGDGAATDIIQDSWISDLPLSWWPSFVSVEALSGLRVKDLISGAPPEWQTHVVNRLFGMDLARRILSIPISNCYSPDLRVWQRSCLPLAPLRDLMKVYMPVPQRSEDASWIWKLPTIPRIQLFIWKLQWNCLPTCDFLSRRGLSIQPSCPLCGLEDESIDHAIFICPRAKRIWNMVGHPYRVTVGLSPRSSFLLSLRQIDRKRASLWMVTAYQIWLDRNKSIFTDEAIPLLRVVRSIKSLVTDCARVGDADSGLWGSPATTVANRTTVFLSWVPPPPGFVKINFDGSVRGRVAGSAFVIRDQRGTVLAAGGFGTMDSSVPLSELYAARAGILYAICVLKAKRIVVEGDSKVVISWLQMEGCPSGAENPIIADIRTALRESDSTQIGHIYREANSAADWVAAFVAQHDGPWFWKPGDFCSPVFHQILYSDNIGLTRTRLV